MSRILLLGDFMWIRQWDWSALWKPPVAVLFVTITAAILTTYMAVISPTKTICETSIIDAVKAG